MFTGNETGPSGRLSEEGGCDLPLSNILDTAFLSIKQITARLSSVSFEVSAEPIAQVNWLRNAGSPRFASNDNLPIGGDRPNRGLLTSSGPAPDLDLGVFRGALEVIEVVDLSATASANAFVLGAQELLDMVSSDAADCPADLLVDC